MSDEQNNQPQDASAADTGPEVDPYREPAKAKRFFDRADQVAETGNWDYAIEMYLEGIRRDVDNVERGHERLREISLARKANRGKGPGFMEALKRKPTKDAMESLLNAEWLMSRDPGNAGYWKQIVNACKAGGFRDAGEWAVNILYEINRTGKKPGKDVYVFLAESCQDLQLFTIGARCASAALQMKPDDAKIQDLMRDLSAQATIEQGHYDKGGSFVDSVKNLDKQTELLESDQISKTASAKERQLARARAGYEEEPTVPGKITALADALVAFDEEGYENEAIDILNKAWKDTGTYRFKMRVGDIRMKQMTRQYNKLVKAGDRERAMEVAKEQLAFELQEYAERAANYPTDLPLKYELGKRQFLAGKFDDAIASLQQARRDPKNRLRAMNMLGMAFFKKQWYSEAADTLAEALEGEVSEARAKELRYNLGQVYEAMEEAEKALEQYSEVAQIDYNYRDVRERIEKLRGGGDN
jgi:tetratricopeptide (TPR) repeat protein